MRTSLATNINIFVFTLFRYVSADPVSVTFTDCSDPHANKDQKFQVNSVYGQVLRNTQWGHYLNLTVFGTSPAEILGSSNTSILSTLFTTTSVLTLNAWSRSSYLCENMRPPSPLPSNISGSYCPIPAGPFAFSSTIPWGSNRELTTLITRLRAVDPLSTELVCMDILTTPLSPRPRKPFGKAVIIFWSTIGLAIGYWLLFCLARISFAWNRGVSRSEGGIWSHVKSAGYILASALSGEGFDSPSLLRFCTPSFRDVIFHTQWCAILAMVAVEWPQFIYPLLTQTAWATLVYNVTLTRSGYQHHWDPVNSSFSPPSAFADQIADPSSPIYLNRSVPNVIFTLPPSAKPGMSSFAYTVGLHPQELFSTCLILFLSLVAATVVISAFIWFIDYIVDSSVISSLGQSHFSNITRVTRARSPISSGPADTPPTGAAEEIKSLTGSAGVTGTGRARFAFPLAGSGGSSERGISTHRAWWKFRSDVGTLNGSVLHGNLVRLLIWFHLPITVFSCYQMTLPLGPGGATPTVLAALSFLVFSILIPLHLVIRVKVTKTNKLFAQMKTLVSLGPLYNHYRLGSQSFAVLLFATNIAFGITIGAGQKNGTVQAIIILFIEVVSSFVTSIFLPWGVGASMGLVSFLLCVARIIIAVLMVILTQAISIGPGPGGWIAYGILIILALVYLALVSMLLVKVAEGLLRLFGGIGFKSKKTADSGILGALRHLGWCSHRRKSRRRSTRGRQSATLPVTIVRRNSDLSSYMPPPGGIHADGTATPPRFLTSDSRLGSTHSQPPSVLKPEYANRPYREDSEDDGFIMGAWQPFPQSGGYVPVTDGLQTVPPTQSHSQKVTPGSAGGGTSGFSRVGGGRAHVDSPYAIVSSGSTHTFPSIGYQSQVVASGVNQSRTTLPSQPAHGQSLEGNLDDGEPLSVSNVESSVPIGMHAPPLGAMVPVHIRTKSQTAIVEDFLPSVPQSASSINRFGQGQAQASSSQLSVQLGFLRPRYLSEDALLKPPVTAPPVKSKFMLGDENDDDSGADEPDQQKKKRWYHLRKNRPHSSEGRTSTTASAADLGASVSKQTDDLGGLSRSQASTQRSFVVIRKPHGSMGRVSQQALAAGLEGGHSSSHAGPSKDASRPPTR